MERSEPFETYQFEPRIIAYLCTWCSYTGADTAGIARLSSPANLRAIRVPCSGRVSPEIIMRTFDQGADGVLVLACHIGECHYDTGNHRTAKRLPVVRSLMSFAGLEPERLRLDYVSASEGERFSRITTEFIETVRKLGPVSWREARRPKPALQPRIVFTQPVRPAADLPGIQAEEDAIMAAQQSRLREKAAELLADGSINTVIGYENGTVGKVRPVFFSNPDETQRLVWNRHCSHNLVVYLPEKVKPDHSSKNKRIAPEQRSERIGVVVKPCDSRAVNVLLAENQVDRSRLHLIGMACDGMVNMDGTLQNRCVTCRDLLPVLFDTLIEAGAQDERVPASRPGVSRVDESIEELASLPPQERLEFWLSQFDRCIRCYACRQACPMCNCPTCLYERDDSFWVGAANGSDGIGLYEKRAFHLGRAFHLAGRCVGCDACEQACPVGIPISLLNRKLAQEMQAMFGHQAGMEPGVSPVVTVLTGQNGMVVPVQEG